MSNIRPQGAVRRIARKIASAFAEANYAQRRMLELRLAPDGQVFSANTAPATYAEFLYRTSGLLPREPSARARAAGRTQVR